MAARAAIEPASALVEAVIRSATCETAKRASAPLDAQLLRDLDLLVGAWPKLPREIRFSILALVRAAKDGSQ